MEDWPEYHEGGQSSELASDTELDELRRYAESLALSGEMDEVRYVIRKTDNRDGSVIMRSQVHNGTDGMITKGASVWVVGSASDYMATNTLAQIDFSAEGHTITFPTQLDAVDPALTKEMCIALLAENEELSLFEKDVLWHVNSILTRHIDTPTQTSQDPADTDGQMLESLTRYLDENAEYGYCEHSFEEVGDEGSFALGIVAYKPLGNLPLPEHVIACSIALDDKGYQQLTQITYDNELTAEVSVHATVDAEGDEQEVIIDAQKPESYHVDHLLGAMEQCRAVRDLLGVTVSLSDLVEEAEEFYLKSLHSDDQQADDYEDLASDFVDQIRQLFETEYHLGPWAQLASLEVHLSRIALWHAGAVTGHSITENSMFIKSTEYYFSVDDDWEICLFGGPVHFLYAGIDVQEVTRLEVDDCEEPTVVKICLMGYVVDATGGGEGVPRYCGVPLSDVEVLGFTPLGN